jgi:chromosome segregation ATPase
LAGKLREVELASQERERIESVCDGLREAAEAASLALKASSEELQKNTNETEALAARLVELRRESAALDAEIVRKEDALARLDQAHSQRRTQLDDELGRLEARAAELKAHNWELERSADQLARKKDEVAMVEGRLATLTRETAEREAKAEVQLRDFNERLAVKSAELDKLNSQKEELGRQIENELSRLASIATLSQRSEPNSAGAEVASQNGTEEPRSEEAPSGAEDELGAPGDSKSLEEELVKLGFRLQPFKRKPE